MDLLPDLADTIDEDIQNLEMDAKPDLNIEPVEEIDNSPFIQKPTTKNTKPQKVEKVKEITDTETESDIVAEKPKKQRKPRKPLTDKQKETLAKNRAKALETRRQKAEAKKKAVQDAVKSIDEKKKRERKVQQSNLDNIQNDVMEKKQPKTDLDLQIEEKIEVNKQEEIKQKNDDEEKHFMRFMEHMEKFNQMVHTYNKQKPKPQPAPQPKIHKAQPKPQPVAKPKPVHTPKPIISQQQPFESDNWFG
tara:strand:- start:2365 stop:3108 length:744 start_codon:yes stop_codon:yes gene_type:complete